MSAISPLQKITSDNFKAHISKLKEELQSVSNELDAKMKLKETAEVELAAVSAKRDATANEIASAQQVHAEKVAAVANAEKSILQRESDLEQEMKFFEEMRGREKSDLETYKKNTEQSLAYAKSELESVQKNIDEKKSEFEGIKTNVNDCTVKLKELTDKKEAITTDIQTLKSAQDQQVTTHTKEIDKKEKKLADIEAKIATEIDKVKNPLAVLREKEKSLERVSTNIELRKRALIRYIRKYHPSDAIIDLTKL